MLDSEWEGAIHMLVVREVSEPQGTIQPLQTLVDYEIHHPWCCKQEEHEPFGGGARYLAWTCDVAAAEDDGDISFSLHYSGTPVTEPGLYLVQGWGRKYYVWDCGAYEYDAGLGVVDGPVPLPDWLRTSVPAR